MNRIIESSHSIILKFTKEEYALIYSALRDKEHQLLHGGSEWSPEERDIRLKEYLISDKLCKEFDSICGQKDWDDLLPKKQESSANKEEQK